MMIRWNVKILVSQYCYIHGPHVKMLLQHNNPVSQNCKIKRKILHRTRTAAENACCSTLWLRLIRVERDVSWRRSSASASASLSYYQHHSITTSQHQHQHQWKHHCLLVNSHYGGNMSSWLIREGCDLHWFCHTYWYNLAPFSTFNFQRISLDRCYVGIELLKFGGWNLP